MEQIRAFIAIELPEYIKLEIDKLETRLKSGQLSGIKWVKADSIHLTLKFLGNISSAQTVEITGAIEEAASMLSPFRLEVKGLGVFPNINRTQVAWAGISGDVTKVESLQQCIDANLSPFGFDPEKRRFTPHLTIARIRNQATAEERRRLGQTITSTEFEGGAFTVETVNLMRSQLTREGAIYSRISSSRL